MKWLSFEATASVAYKEFLHILRDRRVLLLVLTLPPLFTLLFGHAFETSELTGVRSLLVDRDNTPRAQQFVDIISKNKTFQWRYGSADTKNAPDLLAEGVQAALIIPAGWNESLENGDPKPLLLYVDGGDINTSDAVEGSVRQSLGDFQLKQRDQMIENLPEEVFELGKQLPVQIRKRFVSMMEMWSVDTKRLYNPKSRVIDYVVPGIIGLILQLLTVTLMACTIARERESGTLYQLMVTSLRRREIVIGKMLPYLVVSMFLVMVIMLVSSWHFGVTFLSIACSCCGLPAFPAMLARTRLVNLGVFPYTNPGHTVFCFFPAASLCALRRIRAAGTTAQGDPVCFRTLSAYSLLPRLSVGEHVPRWRAILYWRSSGPVGGCLNHVSRRVVSSKTNRAIGPRE